MNAGKEFLLRLESGYQRLNIFLYQGQSRLRLKTLIMKLGSQESSTEVSFAK